MLGRANNSTLHMEKELIIRLSKYLKNKYGKGPLMMKIVIEEEMIKFLTKGNLTVYERRVIELLGDKGKEIVISLRKELIKKDMEFMGIIQDLVGKKGTIYLDKCDLYKDELIYIYKFTKQRCNS